MVESLVALAYAVVTLFLGVAAAYVLIIMPGVGPLVGVIALGMIIVGIGALGARYYVNLLKDKIAHDRSG